MKKEEFYSKICGHPVEMKEESFSAGMGVCEHRRTWKEYHVKIGSIKYKISDNDEKNFEIVCHHLSIREFIEIIKILEN